MNRMMIDPGVNKLLVDESKKNDTLCTKNISKKSSETFEAFENLLGLLLNGYENVQKECTEEMIKADFTSKVPVSEESLPVTKNKFVFPIGFKDESDAVQKFNSNNLIEKIVTEVIINNEKNIPDNISQKEYSETDIKENILNVNGTIGDKVTADKSASIVQSEIQQQHSSPSDPAYKNASILQGEKAVLNNTRIADKLIYEGSENLRKISRSNNISQKEIDGYFDVEIDEQKNTVDLIQNKVQPSRKKYEITNAIKLNSKDINVTNVKYKENAPLETPLRGMNKNTIFEKRLIAAITQGIRANDENDDKVIRIQLNDGAITEIKFRNIAKDSGKFIEISASDKNIRDLIKANITEIKEILKNELITVKEFEETKEPNYKDYLKSINTKAVGKDYEVHTHKNKAEFNDTVYNETLSKAEDNNYKKSSIDRYDSLDNQYTDSKYAEFFTKTQPEVFKKSMFEQTWFKERFVDSIIKEFHVLKKDKRNELEVHLKPDFLGKILLKVSSENGRTIAKIITETIYAKDLLSTNFTELKDALREQGVMIEELEILPGKEEQSFTQDQSHNWNGSEKRHNFSEGKRIVSLIEDVGGEINPYIDGVETGIEYYA